MDPLEGTPWSSPATIAGFAASPPNETRFLTKDQLVSELVKAGLTLDASIAFTEHNLRPAGSLRAGGAPVIYEAAFRKALA